MSNITVSNTAGLSSALHAAQSGDTILLQAGTYTGLDYVFNNLTYAQGITIASADPSHMATLTHFVMQNASGVTFENVEMTTQQTGYFDFQVYNSNNIHFDHVSVHGSMDNNAQDDIEGISIQNSNNVSITNSEFQQLERAMTFGSSNNVVVANNNVHDVEVTGVSFGQVGNVTVSGNYFTNFNPVVGVDHPDAIQFLTAGTTASSHDISVTNNVIFRGTGGATQGIFFRDQVGTLPFNNVTIANNLIDGTGYGGIAVNSANGITVNGNLLVTLDGAGNTTPLQVFDSANVTLTNNQAINYGTDGDTGLVQSGNIVNTTVSDGGLAALNNWLAANPIVAYNPSATDTGASTSTTTTTTTTTTTPTTTLPTITTTPVNHAPSGADAVASLAWNGAKVFAASDFGFSDPDGNHLAGVKIDTVPGAGAGTLTDNGVAVTAGQTVSAADIAAGKLVYHAPSTSPAVHLDVTFQVQDDGGVANGGVDTDPTANTWHVDVAARPNQAPSGVSQAENLSWHSTKVLTAADFGFSDPDGNHLLGVKIDALPTAGALMDNGLAVKVGQTVSAADIAAGKFTYTGPSQQTAAHVDILFQVQDGGGTANGGVDLDPTPNDLHFDILGHNQHGWIV